MDIQILSLVFIIFGCILRTLLPFAQKVAAGEVKTFDAKFAGTLALAIVLGIVAGTTVFPTFVLPSGSTLTICLMALLWGWGSQSVINNVTNI